MPKIERLFAFVANEEGDGIVSAQLGDIHMPLIGADMTRVESLMPIAQKISDQTGRKIEILEFSNFKKIGEINPSNNLKKTRR